MKILTIPTHADMKKRFVLRSVANESISVANEGVLSDLFKFVFNKRDKKSEEEKGEDSYKVMLEKTEASKKRLEDFLANPNNYILTGRTFSKADHLNLSVNGESPRIDHLASLVVKTFKEAVHLSATFKKDAINHARIAVPLMREFEHAMINVMDGNGNVPQEDLDRAMRPIMAARVKLESSYFNSFAQDVHLTNHWVGGSPFKMVQVSHLGEKVWTDESYSLLKNPVQVDKVDRVETLKTMAKAILPLFEPGGVWMKYNGPFDIDALDYVSYEFDRPVRHLDEYMSPEQVKAIYILYSFGDNTQSLYLTLCAAMERLVASVLSYVSSSIAEK